MITPRADWGYPSPAGAKLVEVLHFDGDDRLGALAGLRFVEVTALAAVRGGGLWQVSISDPHPEVAPRGDSLADVTRSCASLASRDPWDVGCALGQVLALYRHRGWAVTAAMVAAGERAA